MPYHKLVRVTFCFESLQRIFARSRRANARAVSARVCVHLCSRTCVPLIGKRRFVVVALWEYQGTSGGTASCCELGDPN